MSMEIAMNEYSGIASDPPEGTEDQRRVMILDNEQLLRKPVSDDEFDFDSAFSSESNNVLTDESMEIAMPECSASGALECDRLRSLEDEHETLSSNLMALTSHFAQVQLRLRQIVDAPQQERDHLLKNLEEFAFLGIPEMQQNPVKKNIPELVANMDKGSESVDKLRKKQYALIDQLKTQLIDLERYAYESGTGILPHTILLEKQKVIIDEIKNKINLNLDELDLPQLTSEDLRNQVDTALDEQLVNPLKMKEQLVLQLKTQIQDLERFINFIQTNEKAEIKKRFLQQQELAKAEAAGRAEAQERAKLRSLAASQRESETQRATGDTSSKKESLNSKAFGLMDKASTILQMFALSQINCRSDRNQDGFQRNMMKRSKENCWGDIRAKLEIDVQEVVSLAMEKQEDMQLTDASNTDYENWRTDSSRKSYELTMIVRKQLAKTIQGLMQHGLRGISESSGSIVPFISGCFSGGGYHQQQHSQPKSSQEHFYRSDTSRKTDTTRMTKAATTPPRRKSDFVEEDEPAEPNIFSQLYQEEEDEEVVPYSADESEMHVWELLLIYYNIKNGDRYNSTPARKLSESFNLDLVDGRPQSNKQSLLSTISTIVALHSPYKRSYNSQFKAFICAALNAQKLSQWLHLIYQCKELISSYYTSWSYVANTGFRDATKTLDRLTQYQFELPIDLSIRQFKNIKDIFI
ncbi:RUN domain-containing protein 1 [Malaya genurostris]|uniref:RUN domain-containing protein 1 n=1 Tax=Malaya genurostris TaxID=325434 RepID=UPI0026F3A0F1|nr:RUN domain-containing protein 1 [Malaya genurostris]XP_058460568.1 RUN domain-containing protein 1 [Malaya genurostris]